MNSMDTQTWLVVAGIVVVVLILAGLFVFQKNQSRRLQQRFGPEYRRAVDELGRTKAEAELKAREKRVQKLHIVPLAPAEVTSFSEQWKGIQGRFVDDPRGAVRQGDELVARVMKSLTETFSTERAKLEGQFDQSDKASTEDLRLALRRYRSFFERLLTL